MPGLTSIATSHTLQREVQGLLDEKIRLRVETPVASENALYRLFELHRLHAQNMSIGTPAVKTLANHRQPKCQNRISPCRPRSQRRE